MKARITSYRNRIRNGLEIFGANVKGFLGKKGKTSDSVKGGSSRGCNAVRIWKQASSEHELSSFGSFELLISEKTFVQLLD